MKDNKINITKTESGYEISLARDLEAKTYLKIIVTAVFTFMGKWISVGSGMVIGVKLVEFLLSR